MAHGFAITNPANGMEHWVGDMDRQEREDAEDEDGTHYVSAYCGRYITGPLSKRMKRVDWKPDRGCKACMKYVSF